jgi:hypothetical protein
MCISVSRNREHPLSTGSETFLVQFVPPSVWPKLTNRARGALQHAIAPAPVSFDVPPKVDFENHTARDRPATTDGAVKYGTRR